MWQYFEAFVHRNPLIRDKILFQALFLDADQVYFLRYKHANSATVFLLWHAGLFTRSGLDRNSCAYNLRTFEFKHFGITWIMIRLYSFKFIIIISHSRNKSPKDCNMSRSRICFLEGLPTITSIVEGFGGVPSYNTPQIFPLGLISLYHHKILQYKSDTMNNTWEVQSYCVTC